MNRQSLLQCVEFARKAIGRGHSPEMSCLHLSGNSQRLTVTGASEDVHASMSMESSMPIDLLVSGQRLQTVLGSWPDDEIAVVLEGSKLVFSGGDGLRRSVLDTMASTHFPHAEPISGPSMPIPHEGLRMCLPAVCRDDGKKQFQTVFFDKGGAVFAADGNAVHIYQQQEVASTFCLPPIAARLLAGLDGTITVSPKRFMASGENWGVGGPLLDLRVPEWQKYMPGGDWLEIPISDGLQSSVKRCSDCTEDMHRRIVLDGNTATTQGHSEPLDMKFPVGPIALSMDKLLDALRVCGDGTRMLTLDNPNTPVALRCGPFTAIMARRHL